MAAGTAVSRLTGLVRTILLAAALGVGLHADVFNIANTVPNMLYVLLAGGVVNTVLVPQLIRFMERDADGGSASIDRVITLALVVLGVVTVLLVVTAPLLMRAFLDARFFEPARAAQLESAIDLARYCLPQVFFYGMFVVIGQVLNARGQFGPMMWAPIANNVVAVTVLVGYLLVYGPAQGAEVQAGFSNSAEVLLGIGSTIGIAAQLCVLVPFMRSAGVKFRPRFDFHGVGLGHTLRLGVWTLLFVVVNQVAYVVVVRLASGGTIEGLDNGAQVEGTGYTIYANTYLFTMVPHSIITVSLATAALPRLSRLAAAGDLTRVGEQVSALLRSALALVVPVAVLIVVLAFPVARLVWGYGSARANFGTFAPTLAVFAPALVLFTCHYLLLRGFYSLQQTRRVFWIQSAIAVTNVAAAIVLVRGAPPHETAPRLALAYGLAYAVGAGLSFAVLSREVDGLRGREFAAFLTRLAVALAPSAVIALAVRESARRWVPVDLLTGAAELAVVSAVTSAFLGSFWLLSRCLRIAELPGCARRV